MVFNDRIVTNKTKVAKSLNSASPAPVAKAAGEEAPAEVEKAPAKAKSGSKSKKD